MAELRSVCRLDELPKSGGKTVVCGQKLIAVFRDGDSVYAIDDLCPHMGASLASGHVEDGIVTCPWHAWRFRIADGVWADNPRVRVASYPATIEGDRVMLELPQVPPPAAPPE